MAHASAATTLQVETSSMLRITDGLGDGSGDGSGIHLDSRVYATTPAIPPSQMSLRAEYSSGNEPLLTVRNRNGYIRMGCQNASFAHFYTDRSYFYFNKAIQFDSGQLFAYNDDLQIKTDDSGSGQPTRIFIDAQVDECRVGIGNGFSASNLPLTELHVEGEVTVASLIDGIVRADGGGLLSISQAEQEPYTDLGGNFAPPPNSIQEAIERIAQQIVMLIGGPIP